MPKHNWRYEAYVGSAQLAAGNVSGLGDALQAVVNAVGADPFLAHYDDQEGVFHPGYRITIAPLHVSTMRPEDN